MQCVSVEQMELICMRLRLGFTLFYEYEMLVWVQLHQSGLPAQDVQVYSSIEIFVYFLFSRFLHKCMIGLIFQALG